MQSCHWLDDLKGGVAAVLAAVGVLAACGSGNTWEAAAAQAAVTQSEAAIWPAAAPVPSLVASMEDMEAIGPFGSWTSAKSYGAVGDGVADDTLALQRALDDLTKPRRSVVLHLRAGTYRITRSLVINAAESSYGLSIIGDDPATTRIVWDGAEGAAMLVANGGLQSRFARITWDGRSRAGYGVAHWWNARGPLHGGSPEHVDEVFIDMEIGIQGGRMGADYGQLDSEGQIRRVKFIRNSKAGVNVGSFNALDWWVWDSHFVDCGRGVSNRFTVSDKPNDVGAGNVIVYRSLFERSRVADVNVGNTGWFGVYGSVSIGSRRFFQSEPIGENGSREILQGNRVIDTTDPVAVSNGNLGPLILIDNQFRSAPGVAGPVVKLENWVSGRDVVSIGNLYTVKDPIKQRDATDRVLSIGDAVVERSAISADRLPLPPVPARQARRVFEVSRGANAAAIQAAIDDAVEAAAKGAVNPVVHLPAGVYTLDRTLTVPPMARIQIAGDSIGTVLNRGPAARPEPMIRLLGPSKATVRDLRLNGQRHEGIVIDNADQPGGRVLLVGSAMGPVTATGLGATRLSMQANTGLASLALDGVLSALSLGAGGIGPVTLSRGSNLLMSDTWYEGTQARLFQLESGTFTYRGGHAAPAAPVHGGGAVEPAFQMDGFRGAATVIGLGMDLQDSGNGIHIRNATAATNAMFLGVTANKPGFFTNQSKLGRVSLVSSKEPQGPGRRTPIVLPNAGPSSDAFIIEMLAQARSVVWEFAPATVPAAATDVRIYRVMTANTQQGLRVLGAP